MTNTVDLYAAKTNLSKLVERAAAGEEIVIAKAGKPKTKLVPYQPSREKRRFGQNLLGITYIADDVDRPLSPVPPEIPSRRCSSEARSDVVAGRRAVARPPELSPGAAAPGTGRQNS